MESPNETSHVPATGTLQQKQRQRSSVIGWIGLLLAFLGMSVAVIAHRSGDPFHPSRPEERQKAIESSKSGNEKSGGIHFSIKFGDKKAELAKEPAQEPAKEPLKEGKKGLKDWFVKKSATPAAAAPPLEAPAPPTAQKLPEVPSSPTPRTPNAEVSGFIRPIWPKFVEFAPLVGGLLGVAFGVISWIRREDHRVSGSAITLAGVALCWHWIALGVAVGVGAAILIVILSNLST